MEESDRQTRAALRRYLTYGVLPAWFVPGVLDWWMHRRTRIEQTSGLKESLIHALMMAEVGVPIVASLTLRIDRRLVAGMTAFALLHEATALWDVKVAYESPRPVRPAEQHIHSFLESLPFTALGAVVCLHWNEVRTGRTRSGRPLAESTGLLGRLGLAPKDPPLSRQYLAGIFGGVLTLVAAPYGEEILRCFWVTTMQDRQLP